MKAGQNREWGPLDLRIEISELYGFAPSPGAVQGVLLAMVLAGHAVRSRHGRYKITPDGTYGVPLVAPLEARHRAEIARFHPPVRRKERVPAQRDDPNAQVNLDGKIILAKMMERPKVGWTSSAFGRLGVGISPAAATRALRKLEKRGLVYLTRGDDQGRGRLWALLSGPFS